VAKWYQGKLWDGETVSGDLTSDEVPLDGAANGSIQLYSDNSGARAGDIYLQGSNDGTNWANLLLEGGATSVTVTGTTELSSMIGLFGIGCRYVRLFFDQSATGGDIDAIVHLKRNRG
jgi:hypothetical protein